MHPHVTGLAALVPFFGTLASFALLPGVAPRLWHRYMLRISLFWVALGLVFGAEAAGPAAALTQLWHSGLVDFLPFIAVLMALYTLGGGVLIAGGPWGRPGGNLLLLAAGTLLASAMGTIAASLLLIHPLLSANAARREVRHLVLAFIFVVANAGGALTPLGDPPLLIGFLRGVPFFWPLFNLAGPMLVVVLPVLALTFAIDWRLARREPVRPAERIRVRGGANLAMLGIFIAVLTVAGIVPGPKIAIGPASLPAGQIAITLTAIVFVAASERVTPRAIRARNQFAWAPMREIAILFFAIFATIPPVLRTVTAAGLPQSAAGWFWASGLSSAFLDSGPTYLMFFEAAGGNAAQLIAPPATLLTSFAAGSVLFGGLTYLGNAPNLMIRAIAARRGVRMPGFFGYMLAASAVLLPLFALTTLIFFAG